MDSDDLAGDDRRLVVGTRDGLREAKEHLARRVRRAAYVFALQITRDPEMAQDVAQDSTIRFLETLDRFDATRRIDPWLYQIVRNRVRDVSRRERVRAHESLDQWIAETGRSPRDPEPGPEALAECNDLRRSVWAAISRLGDAHREILVLRDYHDLRYREIAAVLDIPVGTVMSRLHTARLHLRELLSPATRGPDRPDDGGDDDRRHP